MQIIEKCCKKLSRILCNHYRELLCWNFQKVTLPQFFENLSRNWKFSRTWIIFRKPENYRELGPNNYRELRQIFEKLENFRKLERFSRTSEFIENFKDFREHQNLSRTSEIFENIRIYREHQRFSRTWVNLSRTWIIFREIG